MQRSYLKLLIAAVVLAGIAAFVTLDLGQYFSLEAMQARLDDWRSYRDDHPWLTGGGFFLVYVAVTGLSLPGAALMTLLAGALFGLWTGTLLVSFASTLGATLAFLAARFVLADSVRSRFQKQFETIDRGMDREGSFYLFSLRLIPLFPFFVINLAMGLTRIRTLSFALVSQVGMLPGTLAYVNAGRELSALESLGGIVAPSVILSFAVLGLLPLVAKRLVEWMRSRRVYRGYPKPASFDRNLVVIGGGSAGLVTAYIAAAVKARVTLVEREKMGGDCLNTGCVPSKALLRSARFLRDAGRSRDLGIARADVSFEFRDVMDRVQRVIQAIEPHDSPERYESLGVECLAGHATIESPFQVRVGEQTLTTRNIVIASGGRPFVPPIPGLDQVEPLTSDNLWQLQAQPRRLAVLGGGPIGCEMAQAFARLGTEVTLVEMLDRVVNVEDPEVSELLQGVLERDGVRVLTAHRAERVEPGEEDSTLICSSGSGEVAVPFDRILVAVGRRPNLADMGIEELGLETDRGALKVNEYLETRFPNIFACGDVIGPYQFTHTASHEAWYCAVNALFRGFKRFRVDYSVIPWVTFTDPEIARVGLNETEAAEQGIPFQVARYDLGGSDRALAEEDAHGFVKVLTPPGGDKILGATVVGAHGGEILSELTLAMKHGIGLNKILGTIHPYPTWSEASKFTAGQWRQNNKPEKLMPWLERFHAWRRR
ncbi:MAG: FAD-dependent oxidoreductase [Xanthomonadales bacterium]|nr:FAD-dependent oxidoreductase [Xanthomonadales bacterium]